VTRRSLSPEEEGFPPRGNGACAQAQAAGVAKAATAGTGKGETVRARAQARPRAGRKPGRVRAHRGTGNRTGTANPIRGKAK